MKKLLQLKHRSTMGRGLSYAGGTNFEADSSEVISRIISYRHFVCAELQCDTQLLWTLGKKKKKTSSLNNFGRAYFIYRKGCLGSSRLGLLVTKGVSRRFRYPVNDAIYCNCVGQILFCRSETEPVS